jgi:hypothetical protein
MLVVGRLDIAEDAWVKLVGEPPDPWNFDGWLGDLRPQGPVDAGTRSEALKGVRGLPYCECRAALAGSALRLDVSGLLRPSEFRGHAADLVDLFVRGYALGGLGTLWFLADQTAWGPHEPEASYVLFRESGGQPQLVHPSVKRQTKVLGTVTYRNLVERVGGLLD